MKKVILLFSLLLFTYCSGSSESTTSATETSEGDEKIEQQSQENSQMEETNQNTAQPAEENSPSNEKQESINLNNLPDVKEFIENKSDRFLVDFDDIVAAHPYVGSRSPKPHNDLQVYFSNYDPRWVNATKPSDYPPIYAVADGVIQMAQGNFSLYNVVDHSDSDPPWWHSAYLFKLQFAQNDGNIVSFLYQMEGYVIKEDRNFFADYLLVKDGQSVKKGDILGYMYVPTFDEMVGSMQGSSHIAFAIMEKMGPQEEQEKVPSMFTSEIIESGDLEIDVSITGANGASNSSHFETPILLSPPEIISIGLCQNGIEIEELMFGQTADAAVRVRSSRPLSEVIVNLEQIGWTVVAPSQSQTTCGIDVAGQSDSFFFRIQLDSSFVPGEGSLGVRVVDIDEIASVSYLHFEFMHSPPTIEVNHPLNASHESLLEILVEMEDADGIDATCGIHYSQNNTEVYSRPDSDVNDFDGTGIWSTSWLIPNDIIGNLSIDVSCIDWSGNMVNYSSIIFVELPEECEEDCDKVSTDTEDEAKAPTTLMLGAGLLLAVIVVLVTLRVRTRGNDGEEGETWHLDESEPERDERIPEGWSLEEFLQWLDGDMPEDWEEEQWELYRTSLEDLR